MSSRAPSSLGMNRLMTGRTVRTYAHELRVGLVSAADCRKVWTLRHPAPLRPPHGRGDQLYRHPMHVLGDRSCRDAMGRGYRQAFPG